MVNWRHHAGRAGSAARRGGETAYEFARDEIAPRLTDKGRRGKKFEKEVEKYKDSYGVSEAEAKREMFVHWLYDLSGEIGSRGFIGKKSESLRNFWGMMETLFDEPERDKMARLAETPGIYRRMNLTAPIKKELDQMSNFLKHEYKKGKGEGEYKYEKTPDHANLVATVQALRLAKALCARIQTESAINPMTPLQREQIEADIGKLTLAVEVVVNRVECFKRDAILGRKVNQWKGYAKDDLWKGCMGNIGKFIISGFKTWNLKKAFRNVVEGVGINLPKVAGYFSKFILYDTLRLIPSAINKCRNRFVKKDVAP